MSEDDLIQLAFIAFITLMIWVIFLDVDLAFQRRRGVPLIAGKLPTGPIMKVGYAAMFIFVIVAMRSATPTGSSNNNSGYDSICYGSMRC